ncbi:hypothetical protein AGMMS50212_01810 [Spirochaetia bacterium]|nr:hypothetical protein AGMMS50212_01810 [Spirochaetia bacterium]
MEIKKMKVLLMITVFTFMAGFAFAQSETEEDDTFLQYGTEQIQDFEDEEPAFVPYKEHLELSRAGLTIGIGLEGSGYTAEQIGLGFILAADWRFKQTNFLQYFSAGGRVHVHNDFDGVLSLGISAAARYYPIELKYGNMILSFFAQAEIGFDYLFIDRKNDLRQTGYLMACGGVGARISFERFYIEPYIRGGYPFIAAAGVGFGYRF